MGSPSGSSTVKVPILPVFSGTGIVDIGVTVSNVAVSVPGCDVFPCGSVSVAVISTG